MATGVVVTLRNVTIAGNRALARSGGLYGEFGGEVELYPTECIFWGNCGPLGDDIFWTVGWNEFWECDFDPARVFGEVYRYDCINADPLFCEPRTCSEAPTVSGDYHLDAASPCAPAQTGGYQIGVYGQGCDVYTSVAGGNEEALRGPASIVAYPNPFAGEVALQCFFPGSSPSPIGIYDLCGRFIRTLAPGSRTGALTWNGQDDQGRAVPAGVYFARGGVGEKSVARKLTILR